MSSDTLYVVRPSYLIATQLRGLLVGIRRYMFIIISLISIHANGWTAAAAAWLLLCAAAAANAATRAKHRPILIRTSQQSHTCQEVQSARNCAKLQNM